MNHYQAVLFDFDYTLADASEGIAACISYALAKMGLPSASKQDMLHTVGLSLKETFVSLTGIKDEGQAVRFTQFFVQKSDEVMVTGTRLYQDALPCLYALKQEGYRLAVVTTKYHRRIDAVFAREQAAGIFDAILGGDDVKEPKPSPEGIFWRWTPCNALLPLRALCRGQPCRRKNRAGCPDSFCGRPDRDNLCRPV